MQINELDELITKLDAKYPKWELYRAYDKTWRFTDKTQVSLEGTMSECLTNALTHVVLPIVPRCPKAVEPEDFTVEGKSGKWDIHYKGQGYAYGYKTKDKASQVIAGMCDRLAKTLELWEEQYGWTRHKQEGVDFLHSK